MRRSQADASSLLWGARARELIKDEGRELIEKAVQIVDAIVGIDADEVSVLHKR